MEPYEPDKDLRELERELQQLSPTDRLAYLLKAVRHGTLNEQQLLTRLTPQTRYEYRLELVKTGQPEKAGYEIGDLVRVQEATHPWIRGYWTGTLMIIFEEGHKFVKPLTPDVPWTNPNHINSALTGRLKNCVYLTRNDRLTLIEPHNPFAQP